MAKKDEKATKKVRFLLSPTGRYNLGYSVGDEAELDAMQADDLVAAKYAEYVTDGSAASKETIGDALKSLSDENLALKKENEALKKANPIPGTAGHLPVGATSGDLQTTLSTVEEAKAALNVSPATTEGDAAAEGALTVKTTAGTTDSNAAADAAGAEGAAAEGTGDAKTTGTTTDGNAGPGGAPSKVTKA